MRSAKPFQSRSFSTVARNSLFCSICYIAAAAGANDAAQPEFIQKPVTRNAQQAPARKEAETDVSQRCHQSKNISRWKILARRTRMMAWMAMDQKAWDPWGCIGQPIAGAGGSRNATRPEHSSRQDSPVLPAMRSRG